MWSNILNFLCLGKDFKQIVVGKEIESCKYRSLGFEIVSKSSLYNLQIFIGILEFFFKSFSRASDKGICIFSAVVDALFPNFINSLELLVLRRKLFHDIWRVENWLQIHPLSLTFHPFVDAI